MSETAISLENLKLHIQKIASQGSNYTHVNKTKYTQLFRCDDKIYHTSDCWLGALAAIYRSIIGLACGSD